MSTTFQTTHERISTAAEVDALRLILVVAFGCLLRFVGLHWESLWYDEACSIEMVSSSVADILSGKRLTPGNPFGYFALLRLWCDQFGFDIESARALSALVGTLVIPVVWLTAFRMTEDRQVSFWAAVLTAVSPPMVFLSREARVYSLLTLIAVLATMYAWEIIRSQRVGSWIGFAVTCAILPHLHYYSFFFLLVIGVLVLWFSRELFWPTLGKLFIAAIFVGLAFLPGLDLFLTQLNIVQKVAVNSLVQILSFPVYTLGGRTFVWKQDSMAVIGSAVLISFFCIWLPILWQIKNDRQAPWLALCTAAGVFLVATGISAFYMSMFNARYVSFILPLLLIVIAYAMVHMIREGRRFSRVPATLLGIVLTLSLVRMYTETQKDDWRSLSQHVAEHGPEIPIVFYEDIGALSFAYYRPEQQRIQLFKPFDKGGTIWKNEGYAKMLSELPEYWLVISPIWANEVPQQVTQWCSEYSDLIEEKTFKGLYLARFRNTNGDLSTGALNGKATVARSVQDTPAG